MIMQGDVISRSDAAIRNIVKEVRKSSYAHFALVLQAFLDLNKGNQHTLLRHSVLLNIP